MKTCSKIMAAVILVAALSVSVTGCGSGAGGGYADGGSQSQTSNVSAKSGSIPVDSWGYTGAADYSLAAPAGTAAVVQGRSLLLDGSNVVVSGTVSTEVKYSTDPATLSAAAQAAFPGTMVSYASFTIGAVNSVAPAMSVMLAAGTVPAGETVSLFRFDSAARKWNQVQTAVVSDAGNVTFSTTQPALYALFR